MLVFTMGVALTNRGKTAPLSMSDLDYPGCPSAWR